MARGIVRGAVRPLLAAAALLAFLPALGGVAGAGEETSLFHLGPEDIGTYGKEIDSLYSVIMWITTITFILTEGLLFFFVLRFRAKEGGKAVYTHGNHRLEMIWTILPGLILFWLAIYQFGTWRKIKVVRPDPKDGIVVEVMAKQFEWRFRYAGPDGKFGTEDDITPSANWLHVPVDTNVTVLLRSQDVIHSFFLPNIRLKQDTVPGLTIPQWFRAMKTTDQARKERAAAGDAGAEKFEFEIACAELCGIGHTKMQGWLRVHDKEDFFKWIDGVYLKEVHEYGTDPEDLINKYWPKDQNRIEDAWLRDNWPAAMKAAWPKKGE